MTVQLTDVLAEPIISRLLGETVETLAEPPIAPHRVLSVIMEIIEHVIQVVDDVPLAEKEGQKAYWKDTWLQWADTVKNKPQLIFLVNAHSGALQKLGVDRKKLQHSLDIVIRTTALVTGLLKAQIATDLFYT